MSDSGPPRPQGLYDPANEHDACGVGFVANIRGSKSHAIVEQGLQILRNLTHRGAVGADPLAGDGAGILIQIPHAFFREEMANGVVPTLRQLDAESGAFLAQELIGNLDENAGAIAGDRIGADRAAMLEILQDGQCIADQLIGLPRFQVGDEADPAGVVFAAWIEESARTRMRQRNVWTLRVHARL